MEDGNNRPPLQEHGNLEISRSFYFSTYCLKPTETHDGILVYFRRSSFGHIVQESSNRDGNKDTFSPERAKRLGWIKVALKDPSLQLKAGWNPKKKIHEHTSRATLMIDDFVVIIRIKSAQEAEFVTCFIADSPRTKQAILSAPIWVNPYE